MHSSLDLHVSIQVANISFEIGVLGFKARNSRIPLIDDCPEVHCVFDACVSIELGPYECFFALATFDLYVRTVVAQMPHQRLDRREFLALAVRTLQRDFRALL